MNYIRYIRFWIYSQFVITSISLCEMTITMRDCGVEEQMQLIFKTVLFNIRTVDNTLMIFHPIILAMTCEHCSLLFVLYFLS